ncbi:MAG: NTP transferase domain-containing protein [Pseudomonadota bacterium]
MQASPPLPAAAEFRPVVLVLASGRGERFRASGGEVHKLQALLEGRTVLERTLDAVRASGLPWHLEDRGHPGMGDSIAAAVRATRDAPGWLVLPGDLPLVAPASLRAVAEALAGWSGAVLPATGGVPGHPVGFSADNGAALQDLRGDEGARSLLRRLDAQGGVRRLRLEDQGMRGDIDTLADLERAAQQLRARTAQG